MRLKKGPYSKSCKRPKASADLIFLTDIPSAWAARHTMRRLLQALRDEALASEWFVVSISALGAREMARLNRRFRGKPAPTDVLSFEQPAATIKKTNSPRRLRFLGDIVLCAPVVRSQAKTCGHGVRQEVGVLLAHGLLHLLGYDHERSPVEHRRMARAEQILLRNVGAGLLTRSPLKMQHDGRNARHR